jgi:hypothetical protein
MSEYNTKQNVSSSNTNQPINLLDNKKNYTINNVIWTNPIKNIKQVPEKVSAKHIEDFINNVKQQK